MLIIGCGLLIACHYFMFPKSAPYFTYQIPDFYFFTWIYVTVGLMFLTNAVGLAMLISIMITKGITFFAYLHPIYSQELKLNQHPRKYRTLNILRSPSHLVHTWRAIDVFMKSTCLSIGIMLIPIQVIITHLALFCNITVILFSRRLEPTSKLVVPCISLLATIGWSAFLSLAGKLFLTSGLTLKSWRLEMWKSGKERMFMERFKRSCQPLSIAAARYYVVRPKSTLSYLKSVSRGTCRSLIALRKAWY